MTKPPTTKSQSKTEPAIFGWKRILKIFLITAFITYLAINVVLFVGAILIAGIAPKDWLILAFTVITETPSLLWHLLF